MYTYISLSQFTVTIVECRILLKVNLMWIREKDALEVI